MKPSRLTRGAAGAALVLVTLAGCGGGEESAVDTGTTDAGAQDPAAGEMPGPPGASGTIAAVSGATMQVQSERSGQVAVSWTDDTTFSLQVTGTLADVAVGTCVMVTADGEVAEGEPVAATTARVTEATDGECTGGSGGGPGGERPTALPSDLPTDRLGGGFGGGAFGAVTAVGEGGFTVESPDGSVEVTVSGVTTYSTTADATADAASVGRCATAVGDADDTGAVTATRVTLSDPVDGVCAVGLGGGVRGPGAAS